MRQTIRWAAAALSGLSGIALAGCGLQAPSAELSRGRPPAAAAGTPAVTTTVVPAATPPAIAANPADLAVQLAAVETAIRNPATSPTDLPRLGHTQQLATGTLASHPEWYEEVLARLPVAVRPSVAANVAAARELRALSSDEPQELPQWRIVAPPPPAELLGDFKAAEAATGVPWPYLAAINLVESRMGRIRGDSSAGAQGPMQFLPSTWAAYGNGGDINSYHDAIMGAARLLKANGAPADMNNALFRYNPSNRYVRAVAAYAGQMAADERAFLGYYYWQVYYFNTWLPEGYGS